MKGTLHGKRLNKKCGVTPKKLIDDMKATELSIMFFET